MDARAIWIDPHVRCFVCLNCNVIVDGDTYDDAVRSGEFRCGIETYRVFSDYVINEIGLD